MYIFCSSLNLSSVQNSLSPARLGSYQTLIGSSAPDAAIGAYVWGLELNAALSPLLSTIEVVLRNTLHEAASTKFRKPDWYQDVLKHNGNLAWQAKVASVPKLPLSFYRPGVPPHDKRNIWVGSKKVALKHWRSPTEGKLDEILQRLMKNGKPQTPDQVVAHAMFGFWLTLLDSSFESSTEPLALWPACTSLAFPNDPTMTRTRAQAILLRIKDLRNRVSHQEPAWRISRPLTPAGVNTTLTGLVQEMRELLNAIEPDVTTLLENTGSFARLRWLLDPQTIAAFAGQSSIARIDHRSLSRKVRKLATQAQRAIATHGPMPDKTVELQHAGKTILSIIPHS